MYNSITHVTEEGNTYQKVYNYKIIRHHGKISFPFLNSSRQQYQINYIIKPSGSASALTMAVSLVSHSAVSWGDALCHLVTGFQFLDDTRRLHHAGQHGIHALRCGLVKAGGGIKIPHRLFSRYTAVRLSGRVQQARQFLQPAPDAVPYTAAVSALDPGNLRHPHSQVKPRVNTPGLDGGQLHQRRIHFLLQLLLLQDFLRGRRLVEGIIFNAVPRFSE